MPYVKHSGQILLAILFLSIGTLVLAESVVVCSAPKGAPSHDAYRVAVREKGGAWRNLFVYDAIVGSGGKDHMGFAYFDADFSKPVEVRITPAKRSFKTVRVRPVSAEIEPKRIRADVLLTLKKPAKLSVEFDGDIMHNLFLFANPREKNPITQSGPKVVYYGPGVHLLGGDGRGAAPIAEGTTVYIAGGAIVYGRMDTGGKSNVTIRGRGILCGSKMNHDREKHRPQMIYVGNMKNLQIEGITLLDAPCWNMHLHNVTDGAVCNVKIISWNRETDGIDPRGCQNLTIEDCFIRNGDDCISIKLADAKNPKGVQRPNRNITVKDSSLWPDRAHPLLIGPEGDCAVAANRITEKIRFQNIDILRSVERNPGFFGVLAIMAADEQTIRDVLYENIRISPMESGNLIDIRFVNNVYTRDVGKRVENIVFRNITLRGPNRQKNRILGYDAKREVDGVTFENLKIDGKIILNAEAGNFETNKYVRNLRFVKGSSADKKLEKDLP